MHFYQYRNLNYNNNSDFWTMVSIPATFLAGWIIYRFGVWNERKNTIIAIKQELDMHRQWFRTAWSPGRYNQNFNSENPPIVFKVASVAIDNGIIRGASLFVNSELLVRLVAYRQRLSNFQQLIEIADGMRSNMSNPAMVANLNEILKTAHEKGIGDDDVNNESGRGMHMAVKILDEGIEKEQKIALSSLLLWFFLGISKSD